MRAIAALGACVAVLSGAGVVRAADLAPNYPAVPVYSEPDAPFEFGTGWYLRGDASFGPEDHPVLTFNGLTSGRSSQWIYGFDGGIGYKFNNYFRADVTGDYLQPVTVSVQGANGSTTVAKASPNRYAGLVNGYFDLGNWGGLTPYLGAGVGFGVTDAASGATLSQTISIPGGTQFAWAAMAGVSYAIDPHAQVDLGYRHLDLGRFATTVTGHTLTFTRDEVRLGLRYMID